jgi:hypothetical protein
MINTLLKQLRLRTIRDSSEEIVLHTANHGRTNSNLAALCDRQLADRKQTLIQRLLQKAKKEKRITTKQYSLSSYTNLITIGERVCIYVAKARIEVPKYLATLCDKQLAYRKQPLIQRASTKS